MRAMRARRRGGRTPGCGAECENATFRAESSPAPAALPRPRTPPFSRSCCWMSFSIADARFLAARAAGLLHRGLLSLRTRGLRASWVRLREQLLPPPRALREGLYLPAAAPFAPFALATSDTPVASIAIPVYGQFAHTLACLRALAAHPPRAPFEVLVVDDGSSDETPDRLPHVDGLRYHRRASNGGFIAACNDGAALARGRYLVLLNNDT